MTNSNLTFVIAAYAVTWIVILGYLMRVEIKRSRAYRGALSELQRVTAIEGDRFDAALRSESNEP